MQRRIPVTGIKDCSVLEQYGQINLVLASTELGRQDLILRSGCRWQPVEKQTS